MPVELEDHVAGFDSGLRGGTVFLDRRNQRAAGTLQAE